jgi:hypothetical protein
MRSTRTPRTVQQAVRTQLDATRKWWDVATNLFPRMPCCGDWRSAVESHQKDEPEQGQREGDAVWRPGHQRDGGAGLDEHRRSDDEAGEAGVGLGVFGEAFPADAAEERIVDDLDEPDEADHEQRRPDVNEKDELHP